VFIAVITAILLSSGSDTFCRTFPGSSACQSTIIANNDKRFSNSISLEFFNRLESSVNVYWKDYSGVEQFWFQMAPLSYTGNITSLRGHVWTFRLDDRASTLLFDELLDLNHCGRIHVAPSVHVEALRNNCQQNNRAIGLGFWPRAPLIRRIPVPADTKVGDLRQFITSQTPFLTYDGERLSQEPITLYRQTIAVSPLIEKVDRFLSVEEAQHIITIAEVNGFQADDMSTPSSTWLQHGQSPIVNRIVRRVFDLLEFDTDLMDTFQYAEKIQVQRYLPGQTYMPHYDALDMSNSHGPHNRYVSVTMYLTASAGRDVWPRANGDDEFAIFDHCQSITTFGVQPTAGSVVVSYNMFADGTTDEAALRASCPTNGQEIKYIATMYFWDPFVAIRHWQQ